MSSSRSWSRWSCALPASRWRRAQTSLAWVTRPRRWSGRSYTGNLFGRTSSGWWRASRRWACRSGCTSAATRGRTWSAWAAWAAPSWTWIRWCPWPRRARGWGRSRFCWATSIRWQPCATRRPPRSPPPSRRATARPARASWSARVARSQGMRRRKICAPSATTRGRTHPDPLPMMTPRERVERALRGGHSDRVPFTIYECMLPPCAAERALRQRGICVVNRLPVFRTHRPNVRMTQQVYREGERKFTRTRYDPPDGPLSTLVEDACFTSWRHELLLKRPEDYAAIRSLLRDEVYEADYADFARLQATDNGATIFRANFGLEPLQELISGGVMGMQTFCEEWMERRDEVLSLYEILVENRRKIYPLVAQSPASHANYGGNVTPEIIGRENFETYFVPHYNEAAEIMHRHGKLIGCHFDANTRLLAPAIAGTALDYIEAFTPAPDTDLTLAEARAAWPGKVLWINFPSSVHIRPDAAVEQVTLDLLDQAGRMDGFLVGITEDMPPERWAHSCRAIINGIERHAREQPARYLP